MGTVSHISGAIIRMVLPSALVTANEKLRDILSNTFGGYTMTAGVGSWNNPDGKAEVEQAFIYECMAAAHQGSSRYQKSLASVVNVFAKLYATAEDMKEQAVYFTINSQAHIMSAEQVKTQATYKPPVKAQTTVANAFPLTSSWRGMLKEGSVLRYYGSPHHGPYAPKIGSCVRVKEAGLGGILVEYRVEDANEIAASERATPEGMLEGSFGLQEYSNRHAWRFIGQGETVRQAKDRQARAQALRDEAAALDNPVDPTAPTAR